MEEPCHALMFLAFAAVCVWCMRKRQAQKLDAAHDRAHWLVRIAPLA